MKGGRQVDGQDRVPGVDGEILDRRHALDPRIVDQDGDRAEFRLGFGHERGDLGGFRHIRRRVEARYVELGFDAGAERLHGRRPTKAVQHQGGALRCKRARDRQADPAGRTRDESDTIAQAHA